MDIKSKLILATGFISGGFFVGILASLFVPHLISYSAKKISLVANIESVFSGEKNQTSATTTILAFGDMMLDRHVKEKIDLNTPAYPFEHIEDFLKNYGGESGRSYDIVVANAEGPFTRYKSKTVGVNNGPLTFTFDPGILPTLKKVGFNLFSQANNHSYNFGKDGFDQSTKNIESVGIDWFGSPLNKNIHSFSTTTASGVKLAFIGYHQFVDGGLSNILSDIAVAKADQAFVIVYPHWGEEYNPSFTKSQQKLGRLFIDAGADAVLGAHPHVIEPLEIYKNKPIFYSMGNFIFDQASRGPTTEGLAFEISISAALAQYKIIPMSVLHAQSSIISEPRRSEILKTLGKSLVGDSSFSEQIQDGILELKN